MNKNAILRRGGFLLAGIAATAILVHTAFLIRGIAGRLHHITSMRQAQPAQIAASEILDPSWYHIRAGDSSRPSKSMLLFITTPDCSPCDASETAWRSVLDASSITPSVIANVGSPAATATWNVRDPVLFISTMGVKLAPMAIIFDRAGVVRLAVGGIPSPRALSAAANILARLNEPSDESPFYEHNSTAVDLRAHLGLITTNTQ